ncbi:hypothetical protein ACFFQW_45985 [Umezawaea endophytica]|uniref:Uncharacterized protein n=1 Tax=Umezawaea endophytica TaxID=1654476 RepID=A0A9X2VLY5_9PSEU|nr:hypothetical protein [Umezawaea endophytica]MCS7477623.1 hypothetical protein [Umezawaea endophytica]
MARMESSADYRPADYRLADHHPADYRPADHSPDHSPDHRPAVQRLQEPPAPPPTDRIELVGERPLLVNQVETSAGDVVRPWTADTPVLQPTGPPNRSQAALRGGTGDVPVAVPPIVSRLVEGAPLAVATRPAVEAPVQRVEQVVRSSTVVQREEVPDVPPAAASPPAAAVPAAPAGEPEDLVKKLYDPLLRRLKAELWLDRERRGALTDVWN